MSRARDPSPTMTAGRLLRLTAVLAPIVLLAIVSVVWIDSSLPRYTYWRAGLAFLIAMEIAYVATAAPAILGALVLAIAMARSRPGRSGRRAMARGLLLCLSFAASMVLAEAAIAVWSARSPGVAAISAVDEAPGWALQRPQNMPGRLEDVRPPTEFPDARDDRGIDIAILGGSSAEGVPYNFWVSIGEIVAWQLREVFPGRAVRPQVLAQEGDTLAGQHEKLSLLTRRPEVMIVYSGHNEFSARFHASREPRHYLDEEAPTTFAVLVARLEAMSPLCGLIRRTADKCRIAIPPPPDGHRALVDVPAYRPDEYRELLTDFRRRLEAMVSYAERIGALPMLILPPASDFGFEPNRSYLPPETPYAARRAFERDFLAARRLEADDPEAARSAYRALLARQPGFAETHYRLARLLDRSGDRDGAYRHAMAARDLDGYPMRCPIAFQDVYHEVAARHPGCILIDGQAYFHAIGRHGLLDDSLFHDGMHPSFRGQIAMAQAILRALKTRRAFGWPVGAPDPRIDPARCADHFEIARAVWRRICLWGIMFYDKTYPMRYDPALRLEKRLRFAVAAERIDAGEPPESLGLPNIGTPAPVPAWDGFEARTGRQ